MVSHRRSAKVILLLWIFFLASCSGDNKRDRPSLDADDRWQWMAGEKAKPLPVSEADDESVDSRSLPSSVGLSANEINKLWAVLDKADKEYYGIANSLDRDFSKVPGAEAKEADRQVLWRTMQLHLSRLVNMQKYMIRAIRGLDPLSEHKDQPLLDHGRELLKEITQRIEHTQKYLDDFTPDK